MSVDLQTAKISATGATTDQPTSESSQSQSEPVQSGISPVIMNHRTSLPSPMVPRDEISIFSILKHLIGKDLTKITMPILLNEPLSFLQRLAEYVEYAILLNEAGQLEDPIERMEAVCAFAVSSLSSNWLRMNKPFNPILGRLLSIARVSPNLYPL